MVKVKLTNTVNQIIPHDAIIIITAYQYHHKQQKEKMIKTLQHIRRVFSNPQYNVEKISRPIH